MKFICIIYCCVTDILFYLQGAALNNFWSDKSSVKI